MSHLVIVDGHAIAHRAYHSIPPLTSNGQPVNAIYGFYSMLLSAVDILKPNYLIVCLDSPGPNFRNEEFLGYRAKRKPADRSLIAQLPVIPKTLEDSNICHFSMGGYEADDLIATLTRRSLLKRRRSDHQSIVNKVTIITGDKDLMQLVSDSVNLFVPVRGLSETKIYDPSGVVEKLGVKPNQVVDLKALMGDTSDNYPGVAGIGPKAAIDLLREYHSLDNIYSHLTEIKPTVREKLEKDRDNAYLSQKLATLVDSIPLDFKLSSAQWNKSKAQKLIPLFENYNFKSLLSRLRYKFPTKTKKQKVDKDPDPNQGSLF